MKVYAGGSLPRTGRVTSVECLRYALAQDAVAVAVPGVETAEHLEEVLHVAREFRKPSAEEMESLVKKAGPHGGKNTEWYKNEA